MHYWTDSEIVLHWICKSSSSRKTFLANQVRDIHDTSEWHQWSHVPADSNPANILSWGSSVDQLKGCALFLTSPEWLKAPQLDWPRFLENAGMPPDVESEAAKKIVALVIASVDDEVLFDRFETYTKTVRVLCRLMQ